MPRVCVCVTVKLDFITHTISITLWPNVLSYMWKQTINMTPKFKFTNSNTVTQLYVHLAYINLFTVDFWLYLSFCFIYLFIFILLSQLMPFVFLPDCRDWLAGCIGFLCVWESRVVFCFDQERCGVKEKLSFRWGTPCGSCISNYKSKSCLRAHNCTCMWIIVVCVVGVGVRFFFCGFFSYRPIVVSLDCQQKIKSPVGDEN